MGLCISNSNCNGCNGDKDTLYIDNIIEFDDESIKISKNYITFIYFTYNPLFYSFIYR